MRGPMVMPGYWRRPEATAETITPDRWLRTGDIGRMDERGFVFIEDRKKDMILVSGFNVYPNEVEAVVAAIPGVLEAAAVAQADEHSGEVVAVFVVSKDPALTERANIDKCRPPGNREPAEDEVQTCTPYLERQIEIIHPPVIVTLGRPATQYMLQTKNSMGKMRGVWHEWRGIKLLPTYHPAYVLRSYTEETRRAVWDDLQKVMKHLGLPTRAQK